MLLLFVDAGETAIINSAYWYLVCSGLFMIPLTFVNVLRLTIQGMGYSRLALFAGVFEMIARGGVGLFLVPLFGFNAACFSGPIAWILADSFLIPMYTMSSTVQNAARVFTKQNQNRSARTKYAARRAFSLLPGALVPARQSHYRLN